MEEKTFYYVYQVTNLINSKIYVGVHKTTNMDDGYLGSGNMIRSAVRKYGKENFKKEILFEGLSYQEILDKEAEIVNTTFINREDTYNIKEGGQGGSFLIFEKEMTRRETVSKVSRARLLGIPHTDDFKNKIKQAWKDGKYAQVKRKPKFLKEIKTCVVCGKEFEVQVRGNRKGVCCSRSCTGKYSATKKYVYKNGESKRVPISEFPEYLRQGWTEGRPDFKQKE